MSRTTNPLADAITVLEHVHFVDPSATPEIEDAANRVSLALRYLGMIGTHRAAALIEGIRDRTDHPHALNLLDELAELVAAEPGSLAARCHTYEEALRQIVSVAIYTSAGGSNPMRSEASEGATMREIARAALASSVKQEKGQELGGDETSPVAQVDQPEPSPEWWETVPGGTGRTPCFAPCGQPICRDHGCIHVYEPRGDK